MYHSHLLINVGDNPDRPDWNITRRWLRNLYRVHQRLCMAFPSNVVGSQADRIAAYCAPYARAGELDRHLPGEPESADVHHVRSDDAGFLFRIDHPVYDIVNDKATRSGHPRRRPVIIVQSANPPNWDYAFGLNEAAVDDRGRPIGNASFLLAASPQVKKVSIAPEGDALALTCSANADQNFRVTSGDTIRFRLRVNPVCTTDGKRYRPRIPKEDFDAGGERRERAFIKSV